MKVNKLYFISLTFASVLCSAVTSDASGTFEVAAKPDHILSGYLVDGGIWELKVYCYSSNVFGEYLHGSLTVNGVKQETPENKGILQVSLGELKYFGEKSHEPKVVTGWYFSAWPQTCAHLPK